MGDGSHEALAPNGTVLTQRKEKRPIGNGDGSPEASAERGAAPALNPIQTKCVPLRAGSFTVLSLRQEERPSGEH